MSRTDRFEKARAQALNNLAELGARAPAADGPRPSPVEALAAPEFAQELPPTLRLCRNSLNGGEIAPELAARFDQPRVAMGCHELLNMIPLPGGGIRKRPPMRHVAMCQGAGTGDTVRLLPFVFSEDQSRLLEFYNTGGPRSGLAVRDCEGGLLWKSDNFAPLSAQVIREMGYCQSADVIFIAHRKIRPAKIMRHADNDWRFEEIEWLPSIEAPKWEWVGPRGPAPSGESRRISLEYVCTAIDGETGEESAPSEVWRLTGQYPLTESRYVELRPQEVEGASEYRIYRRQAGVFGFIGRIEEKSEIQEGGLRLVFEDKNIAPDTEDTPPRARDPFRESGERPGVVFLHQQRLGYASSEKHPLTVWMSPSGNFESMAASVPPSDDDAIEATLAASRANSILWAMSDRSGLLLGTQGGEWLMAPGEGASLTPSDLSFQPQSEYGSEAGLWPERVAGGILFSQRGGRIVRDLGYSFQDDRYNAADLSILARHICRKEKIRSWAWQQEPWAILWMALSDGSMAGLTWLPDHDVMAWHRHETRGRVESLCCLPGADGNGRVFMSVLRGEEGGQTRALESFAIQEEDNAASRYLDGARAEPFRARCVPLLPEESLQDGTSWLAVKKISYVKVSVLNSRPFRARVTGQDGRASASLQVPAGASPGFTARASWLCPLGAGWRQDSRLELILDGPDPVTLTGMVIAVS